MRLFKTIAVAAAVFMVAAACAQKNNNMSKIYDFKALNNKGAEVDFAQYEGKVLLIVNTATKCGFTPQYKELQEIYDKYHAQGFEVLDFPCNQFGEQAPGSNEEIHKFCTDNYETTFPQFSKIDVNGENESPLFTFLKAKQGFKGFPGERGQMMEQMMARRDPDFAKKSDIKWNFTKFLVNKNGEVIARFEPTMDMAKVEAQVKAQL